uniref:Uncharacterized protein n=1 Tax=Haptolina ericina TaxID=156174 RepID=A0A6T9FLC4_9EUKA|mmetsp:Transcript_33932/g.76822  ORF Transcript_33932/g.76822 Transcript_33932/m.76822 type:complete len:359 (+) Transcript_33932:33-1109(+)
MPGHITESELRLLEAARGGDADRVRALLSLQTDTSPRDPKWRGRTPLHWASALGHVSVAELLIRAGADVNVIDEMHATPLHLAAEACKADVVRVLITAGAKPNELDRTGNVPPAHYAWGCCSDVSIGSDQLAALVSPERPFEELLAGGAKICLAGEDCAWCPRCDFARGGDMVDPLCVRLRQVPWIARSRPAPEPPHPGAEVVIEAVLPPEPDINSAHFSQPWQVLLSHPQPRSLSPGPPIQHPVVSCPSNPARSLPPHLTPPISTCSNPNRNFSPSYNPKPQPPTSPQPELSEGWRRLPQDFLFLPQPPPIAPPYLPALAPQLPPPLLEGGSIGSTIFAGVYPEQVQLVSLIVAAIA